LTDVFAIQDEIALAVVDILKVKLLGDERLAITRTPVLDVATYNLYLKGRYHWNERSESGLLNAVRCFEEAVAREPDYALAHVGLADTFNMIGAYGYAPPGVVYARAKAAVHRALEIDPASAEAHASLGWVLYECDWDWNGAEAEFRRAIALKPAYSVARMWYAHFLMVQGRLDEAIQEFGQALTVDPFSLIAHANIGCCHYYADRLERAKEVLCATLEMNSDFFSARLYLAWAHLAAGEHTEAITELVRAAGGLQAYSMAVSSLGYAYGIAGETASAQAVLARLGVLAGSRHIPAFDFALVHLGLGDVEQSLRWLEESFANHEMWISYLKIHPLLDRIRGESRFQAILAGAGFAGSDGGTTEVMRRSTTDPM
jgi:serine/threonine-protein kinase